MKLYILEDDPTVIAVLEQIIESNDLGTVCGDSADDMPSIEQIMQAGPDIILMDFLMPHRDGVATLRQLRAAGCKARCIMISQVSDKDMIAQAYSAGVDFFISKPINVIEVCTVISNATTQLENERKLTDIGRLFGLQGLDAAAISAGSKAAVREDQPPETSPRLHRIQNILVQLDMGGEKGTEDILKICDYLLQNRLTSSGVSIGNLCSALSDSPKTMEQRVRRAIQVGMSNLAHLGCEDFMNDIFVRYSSTLFSFEDVRREMNLIRGKSPTGGKIRLRGFLDGLLTMSAEQQ